MLHKAGLAADHFLISLQLSGLLPAIVQAAPETLFFQSETRHFLCFVS